MVGESRVECGKYSRFADVASLNVPTAPTAGRNQARAAVPFLGAVLAQSRLCRFALRMRSYAAVRDRNHFLFDLLSRPRRRRAMQLQLGSGELDVIANILLERESLYAASASQSPDLRTGTDLKMCEELLEKILARNTELDSDEMQRLADILADYEHMLKQALARESQTERKGILQTKLDRLEPVVERVEEVCVMF
jgi:hypothetical protein